MTDYNDYVTAINKIFEDLNKLKAGWNSIDNKNHIETIEEYKNTVVNIAGFFKTPSISKPKEKDLEALAND